MNFVRLPGRRGVIGNDVLTRWLVDHRSQSTVTKRSNGQRDRLRQEVDEPLQFHGSPQPFVRPFCLLYDRRASGQRIGGIEATGEIAKLAPEPRSSAI
jgi:hypothetical protein